MTATFTTHFIALISLCLTINVFSTGYLSSPAINVPQISSINQQPMQQSNVSKLAWKNVELCQTNNRSYKKMTQLPKQRLVPIPPNSFRIISKGFHVESKSPEMNTSVEIRIKSSFDNHAIYGNKSTLTR